MIEVNHVVYDDRESLVQVIYWRFDPVYADMTAVGWRMEKHSAYRGERDGLVIDVFKHRTGLRRVIANNIIYTRTLYDPEAESLRVAPWPMRLFGGDRCVASD